MSGALVYLVSKGAQDVYINDKFNTDKKNITKYSKFKSFAEFPEQVVFNNTVNNKSTTTITINRSGDLISHIWLEGTDLIDNLSGATFRLLIGGQQIDLQTFDYMADIWQIYMAETPSKSTIIPLVALQYYPLEIHIDWGSSIENVPDLKMFANYILLGQEERTYLAKNKLDFLITQVQRLPYTNEAKLNLRSLNHPVKAIFFGFESSSPVAADDTWTFDSAALSLNESYVFEQMKPSFFHTVQAYYNTTNAVIAFNTTLNTPFYTRYYMYSFGNKVDTYSTSGTCNFSRITSSFLYLTNTVNRPSKNIKVYAVNYNILRIQDGMAGLLFSN